jgi:cysteine desulfurase family protein (TIGR01976 family)
MQRTFDVQAVREQFPALGRTYRGRGVVYFDGPGGSQVARQALEAISGYMERGGANLHGVFPTSTETEEILADTRTAAADFLGAAPDEIAFGANMTTLTFALSRALAQQWDEKSEIVVTELDHRANVDPWLMAATEKGAKVRWVRVDPETLTLRREDVARNINEKTRLVAIGLASNAVGTVNDVAAVAERAHGMGAVVAVDAVHAAPHIPVDRDGIGADILTCSAYKYFGPHVGVTAVRRDLFETLDVYRLEPTPEHIPDKLETGTQNHEGIAGVKGALDFISSLGEGNSQREKLMSAMEAIEEHEADLAATFRAGLGDLPRVELYAAPDGVRKTPTVAFRVQGHTTEEVCARMLEHGFFIAAGDFYASTLAEKLGIGDSGGFIRAGLAPYNTEEEVERFIEALEGFITGG